MAKQTGKARAVSRAAVAPQPSVIVVGLGPGRWEDLTIEARDVLERAPRLLVRTTRHPTVDALRERRPELTIDSFDALYDEAPSFATLYPTMARRLLELATAAAAQAADGVAPEPIIYAVPGHPLIGEESVRLLRGEAAARGVGVRLVAGLSFVEPVCAALDLNPLERDLQLVDATLLAETPAPAQMGALLPTRPALIAQVYNRRLASGVKLALSELYPDDWEVTLVRWAGMPDDERVERLPLYALDRDERADHLTTLYVPPLAPLAATRVPEGLRYVVARLRAPDGCPWDREQTHQSLRRYVLEEAYEVAEVLDEWDGSAEVAEHLAEELGDLLLQVYLQAQVAEEADEFQLGDVFQSITEKLIRRHPHVFGDVTVRDAAQVVRNWEAIKREERAAKANANGDANGATSAATSAATNGASGANGANGGQPAESSAPESALRGIPKSAPALYQAFELSRKAAKVGFEWPDTTGALGKVAEEARELAEAVERQPDDKVDQSAELGDLLFALATLARRLDLRPEDALEGANRRFRRRFAAMEARAQREGRALATLTLADWLAMWADAKAETAPTR